MPPHPTAGRFSGPSSDESFPDDFLLLPAGSIPHSSSFLDTSRTTDVEVARPMDQIQSLDPCKITDDERELLQRFKRREDAYKTALCDTYRRNGSCSYGTTCRFAHSQDELRVPSQPRGRMHPKYKTVLCENFERDGECKYGSRCMYIHRRQEDKNIDLLKYRPDIAIAPFHGQMPALLPMDHQRPQRNDRERRSFRGSSRGYIPSAASAAAALNQTISDFSYSYHYPYNGDVSLPHYIEGAHSLLMNSSSHEKLANMTRTAPSPTNPAELDGRRSRGSDDLLNRFGRMKINSRHHKEG